MTDRSHLLTDERRARLAAERRLAAAERSAAEERDRSGARIRRLTEEGLANRAEIEALSRQADGLRERCATLAGAERILREALHDLRDGVAIFDTELRLIVANRAYLSLFDGLDEVRPGIAFARLCALAYEEGIVDPAPYGTGWVAHMTGRMESRPIPPMSLRLWDGQVIGLRDRSLSDGGVVSVGIKAAPLHRALVELGRIDASLGPVSVDDAQDAGGSAKVIDLASLSDAVPFRRSRVATGLSPPAPGGQAALAAASGRKNAGTSGSDIPAE